MYNKKYSSMGDFGNQRGFEPIDPPSAQSGTGSQTYHTNSVAPKGDALERFINQMYEQFAPQEVTYDARSEEEIRDSIIAWLQPSYDQAVSERKEQTLVNNANLDADAISRGMGASTYLSDVKNRQMSAEANDVASLRSDYGSTLAKNVYDGVSAENEHVLEVNEFNAQQRQQAYELAYQAALVLYEQYLKDPKKGEALFTQPSEETSTLTSARNGRSTARTNWATRTKSAYLRG